nr:hypothetical protein [Tanacetum cinerariifolium]
MDLYEEVAQQGQAPPLSPAYVPDLMELDEHVPVYVLEPEHPKYHVPLDDNMQVEDQPYADDASPTAELPRYIANSKSIEQDSIDYLDEPEDDDEDPEENPKEDHTDYLADRGDGDDEPSDDDDTNNEDKEPTENEDDDEEEEEHPALADSFAVLVVDHVTSARDTKAFETDESVPTARSPQTRTLINAFTVGSPLFLLLPTSPAYDQAPLGYSAAMIRMRDDIPKEDMPPQRRFDLIRSPGHDTQTIARATDRAYDVGYVRALHASEHRMMILFKEVNLRVSYQA